MAEAGSNRTGEGKWRRPSVNRRHAGSFVTAIVIHLVVAGAFAHALATSRGLDWLPPTRVHPGTESEALRYIEVPPELALPAAAASAPARIPAAAATQPREVSLTDAAPRDISRDSISTATIRGASATAASESAPTADGTNGKVVLVPASADPRIWSAQSSFEAVDQTHTEVLDASLARGIRASNDSIAAVGVQTIRPDLIATDRDGRKYGVDNSRIHLGKVSLPAVALGFLPIAGFGCVPMMYFPDRPVRDSVGISCFRLENPTVAERTERINEMSAEIRARAALAAATRDEIARIAARRDRERANRARGKAGTPPTARRRDSHDRRFPSGPSDL